MKFLKDWTIDLKKLPAYKKFRGDFIEELDLQLLLQLSSKRKDYHKDTITELKTWVIGGMKNENSNSRIVKYTQSYNIGRFYANTITNYQKKLKHTLFSYLGMKDVDMVKGHPSLILNLGRLNKEKFPFISEYVANPEKQFAEMTEYYGDVLADHQKKWLFNLMIYGGGHSTWVKDLTDPPEKDLKKGYTAVVLENNVPRPFELAFKKECDKIKELIYKNNPDLVELISKEDKTKIKNKSKNPDANEWWGNEDIVDCDEKNDDPEKVSDWKIKNRCVSYFLQILENECLYHIYEYLTKNGVIFPKKCCLEKDGLCFKPLVDFDDETLCSDLNQYTYKMTGFNINWKIKPYDDDNVDSGIIEVRECNDLGLGKEDEYVSLEDPDDTKYEEMKTDFEINHFKVKDCDLFVFPVSREIKYYKEADLLKSYRHLSYGYGKKKDDVFGWITDKSKPLSFIERWIKDDKIKIVDGMGVYPPPMVVPENHFNTWTGFPYQDLTDDYVKQDDALLEIQSLLKILCRNEDAVYQFFIKWLANLLQYPAEKNGIFPILISDEGIGKGTFCKIFEKLLGEDKFQETTSPERDVWGHFNSLMVGAYVIYINEFGKKNQEEADGRIKGLLTDGNLIIEGKGKDPFKFKSYHKFIGSTNSNDPTGVKRGNRRKWIIRCSDELKGNKERFKKIYDLLDNELVIRTLFDWLMTIECKNMIGDEPPKTEYQEILEDSNEDIIDNFLKWSVADLHYYGNDVDINECDTVFKPNTEYGDKLEIKYKASTLRHKFGRFKKHFKITNYDMPLSAFSKKILTYSFSLKDNFITKKRDSVNSYIIVDWTKAKSYYNINDTDIEKVEE